MLQKTDTYMLWKWFHNNGYNYEEPIWYTGNGVMVDY